MGKIRTKILFPVLAFIIIAFFITLAFPILYRLKVGDSDSLYSTGTAKANEVDAGRSTTAEIIELSVEEGDLVRKDQLITKLDSSIKSNDFQEVIAEDGSRCLSAVTLDSGMRVIIDERPERKTVYCQISVRTGSVYEPEEWSGIAHLLEHLLFKEKDNPTYTRIIDSGGTINAYTSYDITAYHFEVQSSEFETSWEGLADMVLNPSFDKKDVEIERAVVLKEVDMGKSDPTAIAYYSVIDKLLPGSPFGRPIIGFRKNVKKLSHQNIIDYYNRYYCPSNMYVVIVGGIDTARALKAVKKSLADKAPGKRNIESYALPPEEVGKRFFRIKTLIHQSYLSMGIRTNGYKSDDNYALALLESIMGSGKDSRLYRRLVKEGLTDSIISLNVSLGDIGLIGFTVMINPEHLERARTAFLEEIERFRTEPPPNEELKRAKNRMLGGQIFSFEYNRGIVNFRNKSELYDLPLSRDEYKRSIKSITSEDIHSVAEKYLSQDRLIEVQVVPARGLGKLIAIFKYLLFKRI